MLSYKCILQKCSLSLAFPFFSKKKRLKMNLKQMRRRLVSLVAGAALVAGSFIMVSAAPANAAVYNCTTGYSSVGAFAKCLSADRPATDTYRVRVLCQNIFTRQSHSEYGNWVTINSGIPSTHQGCGFGYAYYGTPYASNS